MAMSKIGAVWQKKDNSGGYFIRLGQENKKKPQYDLTVELTVKDSSGKVVASKSSTDADGLFLTLIDPHARAEEKNDEKALQALSKVPHLRYEVLVGNDE